MWKRAALKRGRQYPTSLWTLVYIRYRSLSPKNSTFRSCNAFWSAGSPANGGGLWWICLVRCWMAEQMAAADKSRRPLILRDWHRKLTFTADVLDRKKTLCRLHCNCAGRTSTWCHIILGQLTSEKYIVPLNNKTGPRNAKCVTRSSSECFRVDLSFNCSYFLEAGPGSAAFLLFLLLWCNRYRRWGWRWEEVSYEERKKVKGNR